MAAVATIVAGLIALIGFIGSSLGSDDDDTDEALGTSTTATESADDPAPETAEPASPNTSSTELSAGINTDSTVDEWECADGPLVPVAAPTDAVVQADDDGCPTTSGDFSVISSSREVSYELQTDQTVALTVTNQGVLINIEVLDPQGTIILEEFVRSGRTTQTWTANTNGTYTIKLTPDRDGGSYTTRLLDIT